MEKKSVTKKLIFIFLFALLIRIGFILTLDNTVDVWRDWWDELGLKIATGQGYLVGNPYFAGGEPFYSWRPPGFPLFLAGIYRLFGHSYLYAKIGIAVLSALNCVLIFFLASAFFKNKRAGLWCALFYAVYPPSIFWTGYLAPVTNEIFFLLLTVLLLFISENKKILLLFLAAGVSTGLGVLTRSAFFVLVPSVFLWMLLRNRKYLCRRFLVYSSGVLLVIAPWVMRNYKVHETFVLTSTEGGIVCYIANNEKSIYQPSGYWDPSGKHDEPIINEIKGLSEIQIDRYFYRAALRFIKGNSATYRSLVWGRFARFWRLAPHTFSGPGESYKSYHVKIALLTNIPIFFLAGIGFFFSLKRWRDFFLFYLLIVFWSVPVILFFKTIIRYREPLMPFIIILAFVAMNKWFNIGKRGVQ